MCYHVKFVCSATKGVRINRKGTPKIGERLDPAPWGGGVIDLKTSSLYVLHVKFGSSASKAVSIIRRETQYWERWVSAFLAVRAWVTP